MADPNARIDRVLAGLPPAAAGADHVDDGVLLALRAGSLDDAQVARVDAHLATCDECRAVLRALARAVPESAYTRAEQALTRKKNPWRYAVLAGTALAAAAALVLVLARP